MTIAEKIVQRQLEFYNENNLEKFLSTYHEDINIINFEDNSVILKGKDELRIKYKERFEVQKVHAKLVNRIVIGNKVIDHEYVTGISQSEVTKAVAIYEIEKNFIKKVSFLFE